MNLLHNIKSSIHEENKLDTILGDKVINTETNEI